MSDLVAVPGDSAGYQALQLHLGKLTAGLEECKTDLEAQRLTMQQAADRAQRLAEQIAQADLGKRHIAMTEAVAHALGEASSSGHRLTLMSQDTAAQSEHARRVHRRLYEGLDRVRSDRKEPTPRPGFFR